jgi:CheY-like chemotaxis protein
MTKDGGYVCVVDDDPDIREVVGLVLEGLGHRVVAAAGGREALDKLVAEPGCCLVVLDLMMPGMNGWDFRAAQRGIPELASIPVVVLSGVRELGAQAADLGAAACLQKPVDLDELTKVVATYCCV